MWIEIFIIFGQVTWIGWFRKKKKYTSQAFVNSTELQIHVELKNWRLFWRRRLPSQKPLIWLPLTGKSIYIYIFNKLWFTWLNYCRMYGSTRQCTRCGEQIAAFDAVYRVNQKVYHVTCFTCTTCKRPLKTGDKYYSIGDGIYCEHDGQATKGDFTS